MAGVIPPELAAAVAPAQAATLSAGDRLQAAAQGLLGAAPSPTGKTAAPAAVGTPTMQQRVLTGLQNAGAFLQGQTPAAPATAPAAGPSPNVLANFSQYLKNLQPPGGGRGT